MRSLSFVSTIADFRDVGVALADLGFEQIHRKNGRFWKVAERPQVDIDSRIPDVDHSENVKTDAPF